VKPSLDSGNRRRIEKEVKIMKAYLRGDKLEAQYWINCKPTWMAMAEDEALILAEYEYRIAK